MTPDPCSRAPLSYEQDHPLPYIHTGAASESHHSSLIAHCFSKRLYKYMALCSKHCLNNIKLQENNAQYKETKVTQVHTHTLHAVRFADREMSAFVFWNCLNFWAASPWIAFAGKHAIQQRFCLLQIESDNTKQHTCWIYAFGVQKN
jgi:hypothetical protein